MKDVNISAEIPQIPAWLADLKLNNHQITAVFQLKTPQVCLF